MKKLILCLFAFLCGNVFAADLPFVSSYTYRVYNSYCNSGPGFQTPEAAASAIKSCISGSALDITCSVTSDIGTCTFRYAANGNVAGTATAARTSSGTSCPANSSSVEGGCNCNSGYVPQNGQCVVPPDACANTEGLTTGYTRLEVQFSNVNPSPSALGSFVGQTVKTAVPINGNSCAATGQVESCALAGTTLYCILTGSTYTGATYNGEQSLFGLPQIDPNATPENELPKVCPEAQYAGEVNGTQVCVKANGSANTTQSTTTNPDGTSTTTTTTTACVGDKCISTTTTETKDAQGNTTGTGTSKVEGDKDAFCMANPQAPECKNTKSNFGGTCDAAFTCESEDAVLCAIALDQYKTNCEVLKRDENLGQNLADLIDAPLTDLDLDTTSIQAPQASGSSCSITPFSIPVGIGAFTVDLTHMCAYLSIIKAIVTAFGFVMWTLIVFVRQ